MTVVARNAALFRLPFYNSLAEKGAQIFIVCTKDHSAIKDLLNPNINLVSARHVLGLCFPSKPVVSHQGNKVVVAFNIELMPWVAYKFGLKNVFLWGIGYGNNRVGNIVRSLIISKSRGLISYMPSGLRLAGERREQSSFLVNSVFVKNPPVESMVDPLSKKLIFIGSLDKRKKVDLLLRAVSILREMGEDYTLEIVGDGEQRNSLEALAQALELKEVVTFHGSVGLHELKMKIFRGALLCIQPGQAGLSVLESFSFGVPVLTYRHAVSGGEIDNIKDGVTGFFYEKLCPIELALTIMGLSQKPHEISRVADNALRYFKLFANGDRMVERFIESVK